MEANQNPKALRESGPAWGGLDGNTVLMAIVAVIAFIWLLLAFERLMRMGPPAVPSFLLSDAVAAEAPNRVLTPEYAAPTTRAEDIEVSPPATEKLQFEPVNDEKPLLELRLKGEETEGGILYAPGVDVTIAPESSIRTVEVPIEEDGGDVKPDESQEADTPTTN